MNSVQVSTPFAISLGLGLFSTSFFTFANLGLTVAGPPRSSSTRKIKEQVQIDDQTAIKEFSWFYETAAVSSQAPLDGSHRTFRTLEPCHPPSSDDQ